ncbi:MAG: ABC transporter permease [Chloroflexota bacterium]|nr:ABC transporter permease [Dehalococcoidia bacterium]MDW8253159.1 ABC transporter permease [Chloroflexota bacterium]
MASAFVIRRLLAVVPVALGVATIVFVVMRFVPGDPAALLAGPNATEDVLRSIRAYYGLDDPLVVQYVRWLGRLVQGDLGESIFLRRPVLSEVLNRFGNTLILAAASLTLATTVGVLAGILAATRPRSLLDRLVMFFALCGVGLPVFWTGLVLIVIFAVQLRWFPPQGMAPPVRQGPFDILPFLVLPAVTLALPSLAFIARVTRMSMVEVLQQDYIRTARAKGLSEYAVLIRHALKNALIPVVTIVGAQAGYLLGGAVLVEYVFAWPGLGLLIVNGINSRDYPLVQGGIVFTALIFVLINFLVDLLYARIDPRIRYGGR